jgi:hypothetical protein
MDPGLVCYSAAGKVSSDSRLVCRPAATPGRLEKAAARLNSSLGGKSFQMQKQVKSV